MAGLSQRFIDAGYDSPKYMLDLNGRSVFANAVGSFSAYFDELQFLFVARPIHQTADFIEQECEKLGMRQFRTVMLQAPTAGQAQTIELGLQAGGVSADIPLTIFNIDTFRPGFRFPRGAWWPNSDGYLEVFHGSGANWSYVRPSPGDEPLVLETAEKRPISDLCCTGLYHFGRAGLFHEAMAAERAAPSAAELYVAPIYNHIIARGNRIHYELVDQREVVFCGVPVEYEALRSYTSPQKV